MDGWMDGGGLVSQISCVYSGSLLLLLARILSSPDSLLSPHIASYVEKPSDSFPPTRPRSQSPTSLRGRAKTQQLIKLDREVG